MHGVPCSAYRTVAEALRDPQIAHRGALTEVEDGGGTFKVMNLPFRMSDATVSAGKRIATLGEHTLALLKETGLSEDEIAAFTGKLPAGRAALTAAPVRRRHKACGFSPRSLRPCRSLRFRPI